MKSDDPSKDRLCSIVYQDSLARDHNGTNLRADLFADNFHTLNHVLQLEARCPACGLTQSAIGRKGQAFWRRVFQTMTHAAGNVLGRLDVIRFDIHDTYGDILR